MAVLARRLCRPAGRPGQGRGVLGRDGCRHPAERADHAHGGGADGGAALAIADRRARWLLALRPAAGVPLMLLVVLPWFVAIGLATHGAFFSDAVGGDLGRKLASGDDAHGAPPGFHLLLLPLLAFPATLPVLRGLPLLWRGPAGPDGAVPRRLDRAGLAGVRGRAHQAAALHPAALPGGVPAGRARLRGAPGTGGRLVVPDRAGGDARGRRACWAWPGWRCRPSSMPNGCWACRRCWRRVSWPGSPAIRRARRWRSPPWPLLTGALLGWELPQAKPLWLAPQVEQALGRAGLADRPLAAVGFHEPSLMFLAGTGTVLSATGTDGAQALASGMAGAAAVAVAGRRLVPGRSAAAWAPALPCRDAVPASTILAGATRSSASTPWRADADHSSDCVRAFGSRALRPVKVSSSSLQRFCRRITSSRLSW